MSAHEIEKQLLTMLSSSEETPIREISKKLYVSESTARRYVNNLAGKGLLIRTHGGCRPTLATFDQNPPIFVRLSAENEAKQKIAQLAATLIPDGATVFLDSSSTAFHMISFLRPDQNLTVVTSGLKTAMALVDLSIKTVCLGGEIHPTSRSTNGTVAIQAIKNFNADVFLFSSDALSDDGVISDNSFEECLLRREFMKYAKTSVFMLDPTKRGQTCKYNLCSLDDIDYCITLSQNEAVML